MRTLLIFIALAIIFTLGKRLWSQSRNRPQTRKLNGHMVQCARCGVYVPESEAISHDGLHFCSAEHRDAHTT